MTKRKAMTNIGLQNKIAADVQKLVKLKAADENGYCECVTCGKIDHWKKMQGGHFIERSKIRFEPESNINVQCPYCNHYGMKNASVVLRYRKWMIGMYGEEHVLDLEQLSNQPKKYYKKELLEIRKELKARLKELEKLVYS